MSQEDLRRFRFINKIGVGEPTVPKSPDHTLGDWTARDIYEGELYIDSATQKIYTRVGNDIIEVSTGGWSVTPEPQVATNESGIIENTYDRNIFIYKGIEDGEYYLPDATTNVSKEIFIVNKSEYDLLIQGDLWDAGSETSKIVGSGFSYHLISDGETWCKF